MGGYARANELAPTSSLFSEFTGAKFDSRMMKDTYEYMGLVKLIS